MGLNSCIIQTVRGVLGHCHDRYACMKSLSYCDLNRDDHDAPSGPILYGADILQRHVKAAESIFTKATYIPALLTDHEIET